VSQDDDRRYPRLIAWPLVFLASGLGWWVILKALGLLTG
jgi:hypothetical protein